MKWFNKSSCESIASHRRTTNIKTLKYLETSDTCFTNLMTTSLCCLEHKQIEKIDPEIFFDDPVHVHNYREEAEFLQLMSEWEIIQHPNICGNYFSADFEDELLQLHSHNTSLSTAVYQSEYDEKSDKPHKTSITSSSSLFVCHMADCKERLTELLFADKIQLGIAIPKQLDCESLTKRKTLQYDSKHGVQSSATKCVLQDCGINRVQLKTEALAYSIMGAIGKCPDPDKMCCINEKNCCLQNDLGYGCDHYQIKKFFHLDDDGNILLNINHIEECQGFGFTVAHNQRLYKRCLKHTQIACDTNYCDRSCLRTLKHALHLIWNLLCGELCRTV